MHTIVHVVCGDVGVRYSYLVWLTVHKHTYTHTCADTHTSKLLNRRNYLSNLYHHFYYIKMWMSILYIISCGIFVPPFRIIIIWMFHVNKSFFLHLRIKYHVRPQWGLHTFNNKQMTELCCFILSWTVYIYIYIYIYLYFSKNQNTKCNLVRTIRNGDPMHEMCIPHTWISRREETAAIIIVNEYKQEKFQTRPN